LTTNKVEYKLIGTWLEITVSKHDKVWYQIAKLRYSDLSHLYKYNREEK